jgi:hypothetical protein
MSREQLREFEMASPLIRRGDFTEWLKHTCYAAWVSEELGHAARTQEDQMWCLRRMAELDKENGPDRV